MLGVRRFARTLLLAAAVACGPAAARADGDAKATTAKSKDGTIELSLPDGWEPKAVTDGKGKVLAKSEEKDAQAELYVYAKADLDYKDIKAWAEHSMAASVKESSAEDAKATDLKAVTVNGHAGFQYTLTGTFKHYRLAYVRTFVETDAYYVQVWCWTNPSHKAAAAEDFDYLAGHVAEAAK